MNNGAEEIREEWSDDEIEAERAEPLMENEQCCGEFRKLIEDYCQYLMKWQYRYKISDAAITELFKFIEAFLWMCTMFGVFTVKNKAVGFLSWIPNSLYKARKLLKLNRDDFDKYVPCPKCDTIYQYDRFYTTNSLGRKKSGTVNSQAIAREKEGDLAQRFL